MTESEILDQFAKYKFYHCIPLTDRIVTPGEKAHQPSQVPVLEALGRLPLKGKRILDVGCRDGLYSFTAERLGAAEVIAFDNDLSRAAVEFLVPLLQSRVRMHELNLFDLTPKHFGRFDIVIFAGVLYHLRYPFWALKLIKDVMNPGGLLLIETAIWLGMNDHAMLYCPTGGEGPYGLTSCSFFNEKGLTDTLLSLGFRIRWASRLHPQAQPQQGTMGVDRVVLLCEHTALCCNQIVDQCWNGLHDIHRNPGPIKDRQEWRETPTFPPVARGSLKTAS